MINNRGAETIEGFRALEFDLPSALLREVISVLDGMSGAVLSLKNTEQIPNAQGVYQLFHSGKLVYIGKTDASAGLRVRLSRHASTIQSRHNLEVSEMGFKAVQVLVFSAMDLETALIAHYRGQGQAPAWNGSGFGSNDPGRQRDKTALRQDGFDANYPINIDLALDISGIGEGAAIDVLSCLASAVPYTIRYERTEQSLTELKNTIVPKQAGALTARAIILSVCRGLPSGWQATRLPGRIIIYRESVNDYPGGEIIAQS